MFFSKCVQPLVDMVPVGNEQIFMQAIPWCQSGHKELPKWMMTQFTDAYSRHFPFLWHITGFNGFNNYLLGNNLMTILDFVNVSIRLHWQPVNYNPITNELCALQFWRQWHSFWMKTLKFTGYLDTWIMFYWWVEHKLFIVMFTNI